MTSPLLDQYGEPDYDIVAVATRQAGPCPGGGTIAHRTERCKPSEIDSRGLYAWCDQCQDAARGMFLDADGDDRDGWDVRLRLLAHERKAARRELRWMTYDPVDFGSGWSPEPPPNPEYGWIIEEAARD